jgi:hypothetical protein
MLQRQVLEAVDLVSRRATEMLADMELDQEHLLAEALSGAEVVKASEERVKCASAARTLAVQRRCDFKAATSMAGTTSMQFEVVRLQAKLSLAQQVWH